MFLKFFFASPYLTNQGFAVLHLTAALQHIAALEVQAAVSMKLFILLADQVQPSDM